MKARTTWYYRRGDEDEIVGSITESNFTTWAQARQSIERQIPSRSDSGDLELDYVSLEEIGDFADDEGIRLESRRIALYEHGPQLWSWD